MRRTPGSVLGNCNGFQGLVEAHLLPGGLIRNDHGDFVCRDQGLRVGTRRPRGPTGSVKARRSPSR